MQIGSLLAINEDKEFEKALSKIENKKRDTKDLAAALIAAFGDGKTKKGND